MENSAPLFRVYRMKVQWPAFALFFPLMGLLLVVAFLDDLISGTSYAKPMNLAVGVLFLVVGLGMTIYAFKATITFNPRHSRAPDDPWPKETAARWN
jgi:uncharacterized membrane protein (DUF485 family)